MKMPAETIWRNYYLETQNSGVTAELAVMEGLIWYIHLVTGNRRGRTFKVRGAKLWNRIPLDMRKMDPAGSFKNALKKYIF